MIEPRAIEHLAVVIPARDEEALILRCLDAVRRARHQVQVAVTTIVVADGCTDATAALARTVPGVRVLEVDGANVGAARIAGVRAAIALGADWIANTDADSVVPANWLSEQLVIARAGNDAMVGTVRPDFRDLTEPQVTAWRASHSAGQGLGDIHGANLGVSTAAYLAAGGFRPLPEHEDVDLVGRLGAIVASDRCEVVTSGRSTGRTAGGFAGYLRQSL